MVDIFPPAPEGSIRVTEDESLIQLCKVLFDEGYDKFLDLYFFSTGYNFSYVSPPPGQEKRILVNGSWQGHLGLLQRNEADLIIAGLPISQELFLAADFLYTYDPIVYRIITKSVIKIEVEDILGEFWNTELLVWMCMLTTYVFLPIFIDMSAIAMTAVSYSRKWKIRGEMYNRVIWRVMSQGLGPMFRFISCRLSLLLLFAYAFLMGIWLSTFLCTSLVVKRDEHQIDSLDDAISRKNMNIILVNRQNVVQYFKESTTEEYYKVWRYIEEGMIGVLSDMDYMSVLNEIKQMSERTAFIIDNESYAILASLMCNLDPVFKFHVGKEPVAKMRLGIAVSKSLGIMKFRKDYESHYKKLVQTGHIQHLLSCITPSDPQCYLPPSTDDINATVSLQLSSLKFTFLCWIIGVSIATVCCILEKCYRILLSKMPFRAGGEIDEIHQMI